MRISGEPGTYNKFWVLRPNDSVLEAGLWGEWQKGVLKWQLDRSAAEGGRGDLEEGELSQNLHE